jgi:tripartite-type tricarboxylate transporter receptor subunit TctC
MKRTLTSALLATGLIGIASGLAGAAQIADYPTKPITMVIPYAAGGATDQAGRAIAKVAPKHFKAPIVVANQPGGGGISGRVMVVNAKPDGYTLLFGYGSGEELVTPHTQKVPYHFKDLAPVCQMTVVSLIVVVQGSHPAKNLKEFVDWAKGQNRKITCAVSTRGASTDITMQAFMKAAGINGETIPFRGGAESLTQILGGHTDFAGQVPSEVTSHVKSGRLKILGVCLKERDPFIPDVPTFMEQGVNAWTMGAIRGVAVPKGTPDSVITYLESTFKKLAEDPEFVETMKNIAHPVVYRDRQTLFKNVSDGYDVYGKLIDQLGLKQQ